MTARLKELLVEYAEQARAYDVREQALRRGRRRRRMRVAVPSTLAALSVVVTGLTLVTLGLPAALPFAPPQQSEAVDPWWPPQDWPAVPTLPPVIIDELPRMSLPGYPAEIVTDADAPPLPTDQAVGRGLYQYTNPAGPWIGLVTEAGAQYRLSSLDGAWHDLSPGGRWLLSHSPAESTLLLRDLTGTSVTALPDPGTPVVGTWWSIDDRWLVTAAYAGLPGRPNAVNLVDLSTPAAEPRQIDLRRWPEFAPASVRADGTVVLRPLRPGHLGDVVLVDPTTGDGRAISIDLTGAATPDELAVTAYEEDLRRLGGEVSPLHPLPDGSVLLTLRRSFGGSPNFGTMISTDALVLDLDAGVVRERWRLPQPRPLPASPLGDWESWGVKDVLPEGLLLTHRSTQRVWAWELYDPATGTLTLVTDLRGLASAKQDSTTTVFSNPVIRQSGPS